MPTSTRPAAATEITIDTRPLWRILLAHSLRPALLLGVAALYWTLVTMPPLPGLGREGQRALAVFAAVVPCWVLNLLPLMITSLAAMILLPLSGVMSNAEAYALFGNEALFFILGAFILAAALMKCGLSTRIALVFLRRFGHTPRRLLLSIFLLNAFMACFMSEHAVAAMTFPIVLEIAAVLRLARGTSNYGRALFLSMAWGSTVGGVTTLLGGARAPLALGILRESTGASFSFAQWTAATAPLVVAVLLIAYQVIVRWFPIDVASVHAADAVIAEKALRLGRPSLEERAIGIILLGTVATWIVAGERLGLANVALGAVVLLFVFRLVQWRDLESYVNWGVLLMYGGAICLGAALTKSGASRWVAEATLGGWARNPEVVVPILSGLAILLTEAISNSAVVALLMPVAVGVATHLGMDPRVMALVIAVPAGLAFTLPIGTPANAIAYSSGYLNVRDLLAPGLTMIGSSWLIFNLVARWYWPLLGINLLPGF